MTHMTDIGGYTAGLPGPSNVTTLLEGEPVNVDADHVRALLAEATRTDLPRWVIFAVPSGTTAWNPKGEPFRAEDCPLGTVVYTQHPDGTIVAITPKPMVLAGNYDEMHNFANVGKRKRP